MCRWRQRPSPTTTDERVADGGANHRLQVVDVRSEASADIQARERAWHHGGQVGRQGQHVGAGDIGAEDIVADVATVAIDAGRFARQQLLAEDRHHARLAVWVLPGTIDVGIAEGDRRHLVLFGEKLQVPFANPLGDAIGTDRIGGRRFGGRRRHVPVEHAAARRKDHAAAAVPGRSLEHVDQSDAVDLGIEAGLADRPAHRHLRRLMADRIGPCRLEDAGDRLRIDDVGDMQGNPGGQVVARTTRQIIEHLDMVPRRQEGVDDMTADESGTAGDEDVHTVWSHSA